MSWSRYGIVDLKTTGRLGEARGGDKTYWNCCDYGYFDELAYFSLIVEAKTGYLTPCQIIAVQIALPYQIGRYEISGKTIAESIERICEKRLPTWKTYNRGDSFLYNAVLRTY